MKRIFPYLIVAAVAALLGHARGYGAANAEWRQIESSFRGSEEMTSLCDKLWTDAKKHPEKGHTESAE